MTKRQAGYEPKGDVEMRKMLQEKDNKINEYFDENIQLKNELE